MYPLRLVSLALLCTAIFLRVSHVKALANRDANTCARLNSAIPSQTPRIVGVFELNSTDRVYLRDPKVCFDENCAEFSGRVYLPRALAKLPRSGLNFGHEVHFLARARCAVSMRNPHRTRVQNSRVLFARPISQIEVGEQRGSSLRSRLALWLQSLRGFPRVRAWIQAVWMGDESGFPESFREFYRLGGLAHILALSGQHVVIMVFLVQVLLAQLYRGIIWLSPSPRVQNLYCWGRRLLPLGCGLLLLFTSGGLASVRRAVGMIALYTLARVLGWRVSLLQLVSSTVAIWLLWDHNTVFQQGFVLSAVATALLVGIFHKQGQSNNWISLLLVSILMPILVFPITAFFFGKVALPAIFLNFFVSIFWDLLLIPIGFLLLPMLICFPSFMMAHVLPLMESFWRAFLSWHQFAQTPVKALSLSVVSPTLMELLALEYVLAAGVLSVLEWRSRRHALVSVLNKG